MAEPTRRVPPTPEEGTATAAPGRSYLPAMGRDWLLPLYDPFTRALGVRTAHRRLIEQPDPRALARAGRKARRADLTVRLDRGFASELPYPDASFDRVVSAFMFHHLEPADRLAVLREVRRVLAPGGSLHLLDFGGAGEGSEGLPARLAHRSHRLHDNFGDRIPTLMREAGLVDPAETGHRVGLLGRYTYW